MAQFGRPSTDTVNEAYTDQLGGSTNIFGKIDEVTLDDADFIQSAAGPSNDVYVTKLTTLEDPASSTGHIVRIRRSKSAAGGAVVALTVELRQGYINEGTPGSLIATVLNSTIDENWTTTTYTLTTAETDSITNYADLYLRFVSNQS